MKLTKRWINKWKPCQEAVAWFYAQDERDSLLVIKKLIAEDELEWANWGIVRMMKYKQDQLLYSLSTNTVVWK